MSHPANKIEMVEQSNSLCASPGRYRGWLIRFPKFSLLRYQRYKCTGYFSKIKIKSEKRLKHFNCSEKVVSLECGYGDRRRNEAWEPQLSGNRFNRKMKPSAIRPTRKRYWKTESSSSANKHLAQTGERPQRWKVVGSNPAVFARVRLFDI